MSAIYTSNRLESLCQILAENIRNSENDLFAKEIIITQTAGMNSWLKTELAQRNGVFANFEFQNQDGFFAGIYNLLFNERLQNNKDSIKYKIYDFLGSEDFQISFREVATYYHDNDLRRIQLSAKIADLFDQYQLYRPEMINNWENGKLSTQNPAEKWQQWLWNKLKIESRAKIREKIADQLEAQKELIRKKYPVISLFGISVYTRFHLDFFRQLANITNVNFYLCLPTAQKLFQNELLVSFGNKALELSGMFNPEHFTEEETKGDTLLARIQNQILNNSADIKPKDDDSLQINSCYTPVREAECVYNYLLYLFEKDSNLKPKDVLVITTDITKYSPFIKAVFRNAPVSIPIQVSGAANNSDDTIVAALEQILSFTEEDLSSEKVISLLEQKRISRRFRIGDCDYIRSVIKKANIRFGRENSAEDDTLYVSWKYGLEKILLGYAMLTNEEYPLNSGLTVYPFRDTEASGSYDLFKLKSFVEKLESVIDSQKESKTLVEWKLFLFDEVIEKMVYYNDFEKDDRTELSSVYGALSFIDDLQAIENVPFDIFLEELKTRLFGDSHKIRLNTGRVTVSSPIPVRGLPFRVICFLGLNNDVFPRKDNFMGFDLLGEEYLEGDRNMKETDKFLFLETLLAAREKLYLSFIGQSVKDNTAIPPSIVVDTLLDYIGSDKILAKHPLHGFSSMYQKNDKRLFTYLYSQRSSEYSTGTKEEKEITEISVYSLVKFFQAPIDWYFNNILDIVYDETEDALSETELFEADNLQIWLIRRDLLKLREEDLDTYIEKGKKEGYLPLKSAADTLVENIYEEILDLKTGYQKLINNREENKIVIDTVISDIHITGIIDSVYDKDFAACSLSRYPIKNKIEAYIKALLLYAEWKISTASFLDLAGNVSQIPADSKSARASLKGLLEYVKEGSKKPLLFSIRAAEESLNNSDNRKILKAFDNEAHPGEHSNSPANPYLQVLFNEKRFEYFDERDVQKIMALSNELKLNQF